MKYDYQSAIDDAVTIEIDSVYSGVVTIRILARAGASVVVLEPWRAVEVAKRIVAAARDAAGLEA